MKVKKNQHKVGMPRKPRGQQTGFAGQSDQNRAEMENTPAVLGRRKRANKMAADASEQHIASDATKPSTNAPSVPAAVPQVKGDTSAERVFKRRLARQRSSDD